MLPETAGLFSVHFGCDLNVRYLLTDAQEQTIG
jgi:hypothetical protein